MNKSLFTNLTISLGVSLVSLLGAPFSILPATAQNTLQGGVQEDHTHRGDGPSLKRKDVDGDPFGSDPNENPLDNALEPPPGSFDVESAKPPRKPLNAAVTDQGGQFNGQQMPAMEDSLPPEPPIQRRPPMQSGLQQQAAKAAEVDNSAEMQLLWDAWHKRVAESIYVKFNTLAQMAFKTSPPLLCQVGYCVARDGRIGNVRVLQKSPNPMYNAMLIGVINSMTNNPVLQFPPNSKRQFVEKTGTFTWNYGDQGFKHMINDRETVKQGGGRPMQQQPMQMQPQQMQQMQQMMQQMQMMPMQQ
ncbi:MAG: hypothetical protein J0M35_19575 [Candidatus Obscuribacter phosphatis]|uniref:Uncharacterized protein n=1 Tax=Candidatus Obscuribacter phosphatis TaxID=1906157 RepID=A0A8J7TQ14_9BACT|nr:hypothetical protein [Candidatus Obscuribacter phosphatis]